MYREGADVTVHWTSGEGANKTLDGKLLKVGAISQTVINTQLSAVDAPVRVCANPDRKEPIPQTTSNKYGLRFKCITGDLSGRCRKCHDRCRSVRKGEMNYKTIMKAMDTANVTNTFVNREILVVHTEDKLELHFQRKPSVADWTMLDQPKRLNTLPGMQDQ